MLAASAQILLDHRCCAVVCCETQVRTVSSCAKVVFELPPSHVPGQVANVEAPG